MFLSSLQLKNLRNLSTSFSFSPGMNIIVADNGSGKTNLLEAIFMLCYGKSFRTNEEFMIIDHEVREAKQGPYFFRIEGIFNPRNLILEYTYENHARSRKTLQINGNKRSMKKFIEIAHSVLFSPNSVSLIDGAPSIRRRAVDDLLTKIQPGYLELTRTYQKILRNRNRLLHMVKEGRSSEGELIFWTQELSDKGSQIIKRRVTFIEEASELINATTKELFHKSVDHHEMQYVSKFYPNKTYKKQQKVQQLMYEYMTDNLYKEKQAGKTLYGPQRDDIRFITNMRDMAEFGSRGEQRLTSLIFSLAEAACIEKVLKHRPILLLDDLFSELDSTHIKNIINYLRKKKNQIIITTTKVDDKVESALKNVQILEL